MKLGVKIGIPSYMISHVREGLINGESYPREGEVNGGISGTLRSALVRGRNTNGEKH